MLFNNIIGYVNRNTNGSTLDSYKYTYDNSGNQLTKTENSVVTTYTYDKLNRLTGENNISYTYDNAGNRLTKKDQTGTTTYTYDQRNRLTQESKNGTIITYSYDNNGNLISESNGTRYTYDSFNRLTEVSKPDGSWQKNIYDPTCLRLATIENGIYTEYTFDRGSVIAEYDKYNDLNTRYIRGHALVSAETREGIKSYYLYNAHGDVTKVVSATGSVQNSYSYDAFGNITSYTERVENRFCYAGEQYDTITGLYYLRARYYDPAKGRFTQEDPYWGDGLNLYVYVSNNPVKYVDPSGYCKDSKGTGGTDVQYAGAIAIPLDFPLPIPYIPGIDLPDVDLPPGVDIPYKERFTIIDFLTGVRDIVLAMFGLSWADSSDETSTDNAPPHAPLPTPVPPKENNKGTPSTVTSNKGNVYDDTPSSNHSTTTGNPMKGEPNSSIDILDKDGNIKTRRWFGPDGNQIRDIDYTNHGNPKTHPEWPHEHGPRMK